MYNYLAQSKIQEHRIYQHVSVTSKYSQESPDFNKSDKHQFLKYNESLTISYQLLLIPCPPLKLCTFKMGAVLFAFTSNRGRRQSETLEAIKCQESGWISAGLTTTARPPC